MSCPGDPKPGVRVEANLAAPREEWQGADAALVSGAPEHKVNGAGGTVRNGPVSFVNWGSAGSKEPGRLDRIERNVRASEKIARSWASFGAGRRFWQVA